MTAVIALAARLLGVSPGLAQVITIMIAIAVALGSAWGGYQYIKHRRADEVRTEIERQNNEAGIKGGEARLSRADCVASGGVWDFRSSRRFGPSTGDRQ